MSEYALLLNCNLWNL